MKTGYGLVRHARMALSENWGYTRGTYGKVLTESFLNEILGRLPDVRLYEDYIRAHYLGKRVVDCIGLIKSYMWWNDGNIQYDARTDLNADMTFANAEKKGTIRGIPEIEGICVYRTGHIGVYDGKGWVIEAKGTMYGVVRTPMFGDNSNNWTNWLLPEGIDYSTWEQIVRQTVDNPDTWITAIRASVSAAKADGDMGDMEINKYLPDMIMKIHSL